MAKTFSGPYTTTQILSVPTADNPATVTSTGLIDVNSTTADIAGILGDSGFAWTVTNLGTVESTGSLGVGIDLELGGLVTNGASGAASALIYGSYAGLLVNGGPGTVVNFGTIEGSDAGSTEGIVLSAGGEVSNGPGGLIAGAKRGVSSTAAADTLINQGTIESFGTLIVSGTIEEGIGAYVAAGSIVQNGQSGSTGGLIEGYFFGVRIGAPGVTGTVGTITNFGTINVVSQNGTLPFDIGIQVLTRSSVVNFGAITALGQGGGVGVQLPAGGVVQNGAAGVTTALIEGYIHAIGSGYDPVNTTVVNFGTLESTQLAVIRKDTGATLLFHYDGSVINYGLIQGQLNGVWTGMNGTGSAFTGTGTITNLGTIVELGGLQPGFYPRAIYLHGGGLVTNGQSGSAAGLIRAGGNGILAAQPGTVHNFGTIESLGTTLEGGFRTAAVDLAAGGVIVNGATGATGALIDAYESPVYIGGYRSGTHSGAVGTVINFGTIAGVGNSTIAASSVALVAGGTVTNYGLISSAGSIGVSFDGAAGTIANFGTINSTAAAGAGIYMQSGGLITNKAGALITAGPAAVSLGTTSTAATVSNSGNITGAAGISINPADTGNNTIINFGTITGTAGIAVRLGAGDDRVVIEPGSTLVGAVGNFHPGDTFDLPVTAFDTAGSANLLSGNVLQIIENGGTSTINLDPSQDFTGDFFHLASDGSAGTLVTEDHTACYRRGTRILTDRGEVPVEELTIGGTVITLMGAARPIKWIGRRAYDRRFIAGNRAVLPILIEAGAIARGVPARDLWVSPEHALYIDGVLVPAGLLVNDASIIQVESVGGLEYFHIELDQHDIIFAEGMPTETFVDCDNRGMFQNAGEYATLYPADKRPGWQFCAKRLSAGAPELAVIRETLWTLAEALGYALSDDPDLHLVMDGKIVPAQSVSGAVYRFDVPAGAGAIWLGSRSVVPAGVGAGSQDGRRLGACIGRIVLYEADLCVEVGHGHDGLCDGFHEDEGCHRWTNGMARLPDVLLRPFAGDLTLEVHLIPSSLRYRVRAPEMSSPLGLQIRDDRPVSCSPTATVLLPRARPPKAVAAVI